jgi:ATP-binding cassette subfamily B (MDR/TAP) protein 1
VIKDVTLRVLLVICAVRKYTTRVIDVETAFLHGILEEEIYMKMPSGYEECTGEEVNGNCLKLDKSLYGLVQAARQWWKDINAFLVDELDFTCSKSDPCLLFRKNENGTVYLCLYVDDFLLLGDEDAIEAVIAEIKSAYSVKELDVISSFKTMVCFCHNLTSSIKCERISVIW